MNWQSLATGIFTVLLGNLALNVTFVTAAQAHDHVSCSQQDVVSLGEAVGGNANLCSTPDGLRGSMKAKGLTEGSAYTVWFVYIDDPSSCDPTTLDCFDDADPEGVFGRFDSTVGSKNGNFSFLGRVNGLKPSPGSLVFLLLYSHGPADYSDGRKLARQLLTPEDPEAGAPHLGILADGPAFTPAAIAVFALP